MSLIALSFGAFLGLTAVILGAFGAHLLKEKLTAAQLQSFEVGVKYQMYHAIVLLLVGFHLDDAAKINSYIIYLFMIGTVLFSFSIYTLVTLSANDKKVKYLGLITPLGGLTLVLAWLLLFFKFIYFF